MNQLTPAPSANGQLWQENADKNWWYSNAPVEGAWTPGTPPAAIAHPTLAVSANNTLLTNFNQTIVDTNQNTWSLVNGGQVSIDGQIDPQTGHVVALAYVNGEVWQEAHNLWWGKTSPSAPWSPPTGQSQSPLTGPPVSPELALAAPNIIGVTSDSLGQSTPTFLQSQSQSQGQPAVPSMQTTLASILTASSSEVPAQPVPATSIYTPPSIVSAMLPPVTTKPAMTFHSI